LLTPAYLVTALLMVSGCLLALITKVLLDRGLNWFKDTLLYLSTSDVTFLAFY